MISLTVEGSRIVLAGETKPIYQKINTTPGARWHFVRKSGAGGYWSFPATLSNAKRLTDALPQATRDEAFGVMLAQAEVASRAPLHKTAEELPPIPVTKTAPWRHQVIAYWWAHDLRNAMLALDMGTGKSKVVVDLARNLEVSRVLILCPLSVVSVWPGQFSIHADKDSRHVIALDDGYTVKDKAKEVATAHERTYSCAIITNYESAWREPLSDVLLGIEWDLVVLDESHRIKAPGGKASRFVCKLKAAHKLCLTGTPMPHSPLDLYAQFRFLDPGVLGTSFVNFRARYAIMGGYENHQIIGYSNQDELAQKFDSLAFRVRAEDVLDLPEVQHIERTCTLSKEARRVYDDLKTEMIAGVRSGVVTASNALVKLLRLQQITSGFINDDEHSMVELDTSKRDLLADIMEDLPLTEPIVVFGKFHHDLDMVSEVSEKQGRRYGEVSGRRRDLKEWQLGSLDVLGVQIQSGGVGIDLSRARYGIYVSVGYSLGDYQQSLARLHRPGQTRPVVFYHLIATNTIDREVYRALEDKHDAVLVVLEGMR